MGDKTLAIIEAEAILKRKLPQQIDPNGSLLQSEDAQQALTSSMGLSVTFSLLVNLVLNASISMLWSMMNTL